MDVSEKAKKLKEETYVFRQMHLHKAFHKREKQQEDTMAQKDIMFLQWLLSQDNQIKMNCIADFFHITPAAVSQQIREYEKKGWIERIVLEHDRRSVYVKVSDKAVKQLQECEERMNQKLIRFLEYLGEEDCDALLRILDKVKKYDDRIV